jgi:hypothetical protein
MRVEIIAALSNFWQVRIFLVRKTLKEGGTLEGVKRKNLKVILRKQLAFNSDIFS